MQKFTRPLTREIELAGARLALTLDDQGVAVRLVGSRKAPWEMTWGTLLCHLTGQLPKEGQPPTADELAAALEKLKKGEAPQTASTASADKSAAETSATSEPPAANKLGPTGGEVAALLTRLEKWLASRRPRYREGLLPGASAAELDAFQSALGIPLPEALRALLSWHNGQSADFVGHLENNWDLMNLNQILQAKKDLDAGDRTQTGWQPTWIPFLDDDQGDYVCLDASQPEAPVREFWQGQTEPPVVAPSPAAWLEQFVTAVERGAYHEDPERGTFLRTTKSSV